MRKYIAELLGTMVLVLLGCGSAVFAGGTADIFRLISSSYGILYRKHIRMPYKPCHHFRSMDKWQD